MTNNRTETKEFKQEFLRMASYIDCLLECSDTQKETLINFIARLSEYMPWYEDDDFEVEHTPERTETHGDVIYRQAAIKILDDQIEFCNRALDCIDISGRQRYTVEAQMESFNAIKSIISDVPAADVTERCEERQKGECPYYAG